MGKGEGGGSMADTGFDPSHYPLGPFRPSSHLNRTRRRALVRELADFPADLRVRVWDLPPADMDIRVRPGGWTIRQVVDHLADAHLVGYLRAKLAVTSDVPEVPPFDAGNWAGLGDEGEGSTVRASVTLISSLHTRWVRFLRALPDEAYLREYRDPERGPVSLEFALQYYTWHGRHHLAQIIGASRAPAPGET